MKKFMALLLAAHMLFTCTAVFAEEVETLEESIIDFDITMDKIPEGYEMTLYSNNGIAYAEFAAGDEDAIIYVSVAPSEETDGQTLSEDPTEEEKAAIIEYWAVGYNDPSIRMMETTYGTKLICIDDNGAESDQAELIAVWNGYIISATIWKNTELTEDDIQLAVQLLSDMWIATK